LLSPRSTCSISTCVPSAPRPASTTDRPDTKELFEIYKLAVEMADRISARRGTANSFFFTLHAALISVVGLVERSGGSEGDDFGRALTAVAGLVLAAAWWALLRSYRDLNAAKFRVINEMERSLPVSPFAQEWEYLRGTQPKPLHKRYAEFGVIERIVPLVFALLYVAAIVELLAD
jgi:hypothetical protein